MSRRFIFSLLGLLALGAPAATQAQAQAPISEADLRRHVEMLASDRFEGRRPGTLGEQLTTEYLTRELAARGVKPGAAGNTWFQPVPLVQRGASTHRITITRDGRPIAFPADAVVLTGNQPDVRVENAPLVFAGHGVVIPERGIDQLAGADLRGAIALILYEGPQLEGFPSFPERVATLGRAGTRAVIAIVGPDLPWDQVRTMSAGGSTQLENPHMPPTFGAMSWDGATALVQGAGLDLDRLLNEQPGSSFRAVPLPLRATLDVKTQLRRFTSNNIVGRIEGTQPGNESIVLLGHWDHLGLCAPEGAEDRICNGAVDNASGIATLIEAAGRLAVSSPPARDILLLFTTAEEMGLLGAEYFARNRVQTEPIVAGINVDTAAVAPAGTPVAVIGGTPAMDLVIGKVALGLGRKLDADREADIMEQRQDGWALTRGGIPTFMAGSTPSDMNLLRRFLGGTYHGPDDEISAGIEYGGAVEDANLLVALARAFADPAQYTPPAPGERG